MTLSKIVFLKKNDGVTFLDGLFLSLLFFFPLLFHTSLSLIYPTTTHKLLPKIAGNLNSILLLFKRISFQDIGSHDFFTHYFLFNIRQLQWLCLLHILELKEVLLLDRLSLKVGRLSLLCYVTHFLKKCYVPSGNWLFPDWFFFLILMLCFVLYWLSSKDRA